MPEKTRTIGGGPLYQMLWSVSTSLPQEAGSYTTEPEGTMANEEQLQIISGDGVDHWNSWRLQNPDVHTDLDKADLDSKYLRNANFHNTNLRGAVLRAADLQDANLLNADLEGADFTDAILSSANLTHANLKGAVLFSARLRNANLEGANLKGVSLQNAVLSGANLVNVNLRDADVSGAKFDGAQFTIGTLGLGRLTQEQRKSMTLVDVEPLPEDASEEPDPQTSDHTDTLTVGYARSIVEPAHSVLQHLSIPNDLTEENRDLFSEMRRTVEELRRSLADLEEKDRLLSEENTGVGDKIDQALPIWKLTWLTFVASAGGGAAGSAGSFTAGYTAGFIAGVLHDTFSPGVSCIT